MQGITEGGPGVATRAGGCAVSAKRSWDTRAGEGGGWGGVGWGALGGMNMVGGVGV